MSSVVPLPTAALLTTEEARAYCSKRVILEFLVDQYNLKPIYKGKGGKTVVFSRSAIDHALTQLELNGGHDVDTDKPVAVTS
jgi:hypothetical protein